MPGGRISPDGRPAQAKGVGKNSKRHDLERPKTPGLHGSDLQQGDVQAMEQGQRVAPAASQDPAVQGAAPSAPAPRDVPQQSASAMQVPDAIDFLGGQQGPEFGAPRTHRQLDNSGFLSWLPVLRQLVAGPGSSGVFADMLVQSASAMRQSGGQPASFVDLQAADDGIEAMLNVGVRSE